MSRKGCGFDPRSEHKKPPIAQLVEQSPLKRTVVGSSPTGRTLYRLYKVINYNLLILSLINVKYSYCLVIYFNARVAELVDALVLGTSEATRGGSSPLSRTNSI